MTRSAFIPEYASLPDRLPIFPLEDAVLMPQFDLPLNIFEPRYLNMVEDALRGERMFGMVQPDPRGRGDPAAVYATGCAGRITSYQETSDARILLSLSGVCRFDIRAELPATRGYRLVVPDWSRFFVDYRLEEEASPDLRKGLIEGLRRYFRVTRLEVDWAVLEELPTTRLVNTLSAVLPLAPAEKQAILEAVSLAERLTALRAALECSGPQAPGRSRH